MKKQFTLDANDQSFTFCMTNSAYNNMINQSGKSLVGAATQMLQATIIDDERDALNAFIDANPAAPMALAEFLVKQFAPQVSITLKNS